MTMITDVRVSEGFLLQGLVPGRLSSLGPQRRRVHKRGGLRQNQFSRLRCLSRYRCLRLARMRPRRRQQCAGLYLQTCRSMSFQRSQLAMRGPRRRLREEGQAQHQGLFLQHHQLQSSCRLPRLQVQTRSTLTTRPTRMSSNYQIHRAARRQRQICQDPESFKGLLRRRRPQGKRQCQARTWLRPSRLRQRPRLGQSRRRRPCERLRHRQWNTHRRWLLHVRPSEQLHLRRSRPQHRRHQTAKRTRWTTMPRTSPRWAAASQRRKLWDLRRSFFNQGIS